MAKEIRKETDIWGREKEVIYEDNEKTGEIRNETTFWGTPVKREYNAGGEQVNETRHEHTWSGKAVERTYSPNGEQLTETRHEKTFAGTPVDRAYDNDENLVSETRREHTFFGTPVKREYDKRQPSVGERSGAAQSSYSSYASSGGTGSGSKSSSALAWLALLIAVAIGTALVLPILRLVLRNALLQPAPIIDSVPSLEQAKESIPESLKRIYGALNQGNPRAVNGLVLGRLLNDYRKLDYICKPFTYRAHYIEAIIEREGGQFQVRVRVLFEPLDEHAYMLLFRFLQGQFVLVDVTEPSGDWFGSEKEVATDLARNFIYAAKAQKRDVLPQLVSAGIPTSSFVTDTCWQQFFEDTTEPRVVSVSLKSYKGLKTEVQLDIGPAAGFGFRAVGHAYFLIDRVGGEYKIVSADPRSNYKNYWPPNDACKDESVLPKVEDPTMEARTLKRFGLSKSE